MSVISTFNFKKFSARLQELLVAIVQFSQQPDGSGTDRPPRPAENVPGVRPDRLDAHRLESVPKVDRCSVDGRGYLVHKPADSSVQVAGSSVQIPIFGTDS